MKTIQKILHCLGHRRISAFHPKCVHNRKCNSINGGQKRNFDAIHKSGYRACHHFIIRGLEILKSPHKTDKCSKDTKACKNVRSHLKESLVDMYIYILNIHKILYFSDSFFRSADTINKIIHLFVEIAVTKNPSQLSNLFFSGSSRKLKHFCDLTSAMLQCS